MSLQRWLPLESNPDVLNNYAYGIGMSNSWRFVDVFGLDEDSLAAIPQPVAAVVLLFPWTKNAEAMPLGTVTSDSNDVYFIKQTNTIGNACGTIALVHALSNNAELLQIEPSSVLGSFLSKSKDKSPEERASLLEHSRDMSSVHEESAQEGQTDTPARDEDVEYHFIALLWKDNCLYELDGLKSGPVFHSHTTNDTFLADSAEVVRKFMERDPEELNFTVMALVDATDL